MEKSQRQQLNEYKKKYDEQLKNVKKKEKEFNILKKQLLEELDYSEMIENKKYKKKNMEVVKEKRIAKGLEMKVIKFREEVMKSTH